jgi:hypothetical protein
MRRFFLLLAGATVIVASVASLATGSNSLTILTAVATFLGSVVAGGLVRMAGGPDLEIVFLVEADHRCIRIDNKIYSDAMEPKVFFDLITLQEDGARRLIKSKSTTLAHLPKRLTGSKHSSTFVSVPEVIASMFTGPEMELVVGVTSVHKNTNFRELVTETVSFSAFHARSLPDARIERQPAQSGQPMSDVVPGLKPETT